MALSSILLTAAWQLAAISAAATLLALLVQGSSAKARIWSWAVALALVVPLLSISTPKYVVAPSTSPAPGSLLTPPQPPAGVPSLWRQTLVTVWMGGAAVGVLRLLTTWLATARLLRHSKPFPCLHMHQLAPDLCRRTPMEVRLLSSAVSPFCWQFRRTVIVLPAAADAIPEPELDMILRHELAHVQRHDPVMLFLQRVAEIVYWFHPAVWWAGWQLTKFREFACDDAVAAEPTDVQPYLLCLIRLLEGQRAAPAAAVGLLRERRLILVRLQRLMQAACQAPKTRSPLRSGVAACALLVTLGALLTLLRLGPSPCAHARSGWTAWPAASAPLLHAIGLPARDFELDAHRRLPWENTREHLANHKRRQFPPPEF